MVALSLLALAACGDDADDAAPSTTSSTTSTTTSTTSEATSTTEVTTAYTPDPIRWSRCGSFECATVSVPLDYERPTGAKIRLGVTRRRASGDRIGAVFLNPGGPGASAVEFARALSPLLPSQVRDRFDIVGVDPRGVGASTPLDCNGDFVRLYGADPTIEDAADRDRLLRISREYVAGCTRAGERMLPYLGTREVARDMDAVRAAMGDATLSYVGFSYGTAIGQVYADLFPKRVRAMVLDGVVELGPTGIQQAVDQAKGFERALASYCRRHECERDGEPMGRIDEVLRRAEARIPAPRANRALGPGEAALGLAYPLYAESLWNDLDDAIDDALDGDGSAMVALADRYLNIASFDVYYAAGCLDQRFPRDPDTVLEAGKDAARSSPHFGEAIVNDYVRCALWPVRSKALPPVTAPTAPPILVISTTNDPATPYEAGVAVAAQLASGVLLTYDGDGHGVFATGVSCVDDTVTRYLVDLDPPADGARC